MTSNNMRLNIFIVFFIALFSASYVIAEEAQIKANYQIEESVVWVKQQLPITLEVRSLSPFGDDLTAPYLDIPNTVVKTDVQSLIRTSVKEGDKTWFIQKVNYYLYPLKAGKIFIPDATFPVSLRDENEDKSNHTVTVKSIRAQANAIEAIKGSQSILVAPSASLSVKIEGEAEEYAVGDAISLNYKFQANETHDVVLPSLKIDPITGAEIYAKPEKKHNELNRLSRKTYSHSTNEITVVFNEAGMVSIPSVSVTWFNTKSNQLEQLSTKAYSFKVGNAGLISTLKSVFKSLDKVLLLIVLTAVLIISLLCVFIYKSRHTLGLILVKAEQRKKNHQLENHYLDAVHQNLFDKAYRSLIKIAALNGQSSHHVVSILNDSERSTWERIQYNAFSNAEKQPISRVEATALLSAIKGRKTQKATKSTFQFDWDINPK